MTHSIEDFSNPIRCSRVEPAILMMNQCCTRITHLFIVRTEFEFTYHKDFIHQSFTPTR